MTNYEKHKDEIIKHILFHDTCKLIRELMGINCGKAKCSDCKKLTEEWLDAEYVEPEVDWDKVEQGTKVYADGSSIGRFVAVYNAYIITDRSVGYYSYPKEMCKLER